MIDRQQDWEPDVNHENLERYHKDGNDLSPYINQGQRISDLRNMADLSVKELATATGITTQELLALEAGLQHLQPTVAMRMADAIGVRLSDIWIDGSN